MDLTQFYNHEKFMKGVREGEKLTNNIPKGNDKQLYNVGDCINGNGIQNATITGLYVQNGYVYYEVVWTYGKNKKASGTISQKKALQNKGVR